MDTINEKIKIADNNIIRNIELIDSEGNLLEILFFFETMGFKRIKMLRKIRENYLFEGIKISIDNNFEIPKNMEIEWKSIDSICSFVSKIWFL